MQFYSTTRFYPDGRIVWMSEGTRYQSTVDEWAKLINAPEEHEDDLDVYATKKKDHNTMANMYKEIPDKALETHKLGSVHFLLSGLPTINTIHRHTLLPKSGDHKMIRGHSINLLQLFDVPQKFKVMSLIVETIKRTAADQKRSCWMLHTFTSSSTPRWAHEHIYWIRSIYPYILILKITLL